MGKASGRSSALALLLTQRGFENSFGVGIILSNPHYRYRLFNRSRFHANHGETDLAFFPVELDDFNLELVAGAGHAFLATIRQFAHMQKALEVIRQLHEDAEVRYLGNFTVMYGIS